MLEFIGSGVCYSVESDCKDETSCRTTWQKQIDERGNVRIVWQVNFGHKLKLMGTKFHNAMCIRIPAPGGPPACDQALHGSSSSPKLRLPQG